jgi:hypothetical protein
MRQRTTAEFSDLTDTIERRGFAVSVHHMGDYVEMYAVQLQEPCAQHIATVWDGDEEEHLYRCVRELSRMVRIEPGDQ